MTHVIIGKGNLGVDLAICLRSHGHQVYLFTRSEGFKWPDDQKKILHLFPTHIWITAGHGSVKECEQDFAGALYTHVALPMMVARAFPTAKVAVFSTDYVADTVRPRTLYEQSKMWMEDGLRNINRGNTVAIRVGSLYGWHRPEKSFPGRLRERYPKPCEVTLPDNIVTPTPTCWIVDMIGKNLDTMFDPKEFRLHSMAPIGNTTTRDWGKLILGKAYDVRSGGYDLLRPMRSSIGYTLRYNDKRSWRELWAAYGV